MQVLGDNKPYTLDKLVRIGFACLVVWALIALANYLSDVLIPFGIAVLMAYLINPLVVLVQKKVPQRSFAVLISLSLVVVVGGVLSFYCVQLIISEMLRFGDLLQQFASDQQWKERLVTLVPDEMVAEIERVMSKDGVANILTKEGAWAYVSDTFSSVAPWIKDVGVGLLGLLGLSVIALYVVFLLMDYDWFIENWNNVVPPKQRAHVDGFLAEFNDAMHRHFRAQAIVALCCGVLFAIGFSIIGLPMAILFGLFVGLLNMIPYVQILALLPASLLATMLSLEDGSGLVLNLCLVMAVFAVVQIIQDAVLVPRIMGEAFGLRPVVILLSIMIWGKLLGFLGLIIALPLTCLAWAWYQRLVIKPQLENDVDND